MEIISAGLILVYILYDKTHFSSGLSLIPKLKKEHVHLNSYSRMRVNLAAQVRRLQVGILCQLYNIIDLIVKGAKYLCGKCF